MDEPLELEVAEEISDLGPFDPGDPAALVESERAPKPSARSRPACA
jgi:hypothetical protein